MKKTIRSLAIYASLAVVAVASFASVSAQTPTPAQTPTSAPAAASTTCTDEIKGALYADFTKFRTTDPTKANEAAKKYLAACPTEEGQIPSYLKKWVVAYDKEARKFNLNRLFIDQRKYAEAFPIAKEVLADEPDNLTALFALGYGGYVNAVNTKNESNNAEAVNYTKKSIQAIESGKAPENWAPFKSKDDALGYLYYSLAYLQRVSNPSDSLKDFVKAAQFDSELKKGAQTYAMIANAYETEYAKQSEAYLIYKDKPETPESKLAAENINQLVDRIIDALARAVAVAGTDANAQAAKTQWLARLTELYKFRHNGSEDGLKEMIATVISKPLPPVPTPITTLPTTPATTTTPATGTNTSTVGSAVAPGAAAPAAATKTTTTAAATPAATPTAVKTTSAATAASKKPAAKPKTRNNHKRH
jgi:hypothetical protein